ncbi:conserved hypothetical protein [Alkaliphilus metalliredigens QYMF]|uniref:Phage holin family protein n=1 Tax=Alkaliphilus metalliredigens (strain QYMF) TaxID=293826 RepID=A6TWE3_ALKMQ|nr:phage holin family protein [Alkaliphilus metalliredigens]ABR50511.1 conserved hypothetical protein [Alkaliphilus metalliredigens QYMF]
MSEDRNNDRNQNRTQASHSWVGIILRFVVSAIVIAVAAFLTPGFRIEGVWGIVVAAAVISIVDYLIQRVVGFDASPFGKGITGFIVAAIVLYGAQFIVPAMRVTFLGAILGAIVIGILDMIIPGKTM